MPEWHDVWRGCQGWGYTRVVDIPERWIYPGGGYTGRGTGHRMCETYYRRILWSRWARFGGFYGHGMRLDGEKCILCPRCSREAAAERPRAAAVQPRGRRSDRPAATVPRRPFRSDRSGCRARRDGVAESAESADFEPGAGDGGAGEEGVEEGDDDVVFALKFEDAAFDAFERPFHHADLFALL